MEHNELEKKAYEIVDSFLNKLEKGKEIFFNTYCKPQEYNLAKQILEKYDLIIYRAPGEKSSIVDITQNGLEIIKVGGIQKFLDSKTQQEESKELKEKLEFEKLQAEIVLIQKQLFDYEKTKKRAKRSEWIAIIAILITIISLILPLFTCSS
ncbi:MAG: hypothetical protein ACOYLE_02865 [Bacteroidales bacterium]